MLKKTKDMLTEDRFSIGDYTYGQLEVIGPVGRVTAGKFCSISKGAKVIIDEHHADWITTYPFSDWQVYDEWPEAKGIGGYPFNKGNVVIGNDVWICRDAIILSGVTIGDGAVIGAGAVVGKDIPAYGVAIGNPAKVIKYRFNEEGREFLLKLQWWHWDVLKIKRNMRVLCSGNIDALRRIDAQGA